MSTKEPRTENRSVYNMHEDLSAGLTLQSRQKTIKRDVHIAVMPLEQYECQRARDCSPVPHLWALLEAVTDPEIPAISIWELGVLRAVEVQHGAVLVTITPTYSGCPAMETIATDIQQALSDSGYADCQVLTQLAPAWSTSWISAEGREKLEVYGVAPPGQARLRCPRCKSERVALISEFGSTACKALYSCNDCLEPFDVFKNF